MHAIECLYLLSFLSELVVL